MTKDVVIDHRLVPLLNLLLRHFEYNCVNAKMCHLLVNVCRMCRKVISCKIKICNEFVEGIICVKAASDKDLEKGVIRAALMTGGGKIMIQMKEIMNVTVVENVLREHTECYPRP